MDPDIPGSDAIVAPISVAATDPATSTTDQPLPDFVETKALKTQHRATAKCNTHRVPGEARRGAKLKPKAGPDSTGPATQTPCNLLICWYCQVHHDDLNHHLESCTDLRCKEYVTKRDNGTLDLPQLPPLGHFTTTPGKNAASKSSLTTPSNTHGSCHGAFDFDSAGQAVDSADIAASEKQALRWKKRGKSTWVCINSPGSGAGKFRKTAVGYMPLNSLADRASAVVMDSLQSDQLFQAQLISSLAIGVSVTLTLPVNQGDSTGQSRSHARPMESTDTSPTPVRHSLRTLMPGPVPTSTFGRERNYASFTDEELALAAEEQNKRKAAAEADELSKRRRIQSPPRAEPADSHSDNYPSSTFDPRSPMFKPFTAFHEAAANSRLRYSPAVQLPLPPPQHAHSSTSASFGIDLPRTMDAPTTRRGTGRHEDDWMRFEPGSAAEAHARQVAAFNQRPQPYATQRNPARDRAIEQQVKRLEQEDRARQETAMIVDDDDLESDAATAKKGKGKSRR